MFPATRDLRIDRAPNTERRWTISTILHAIYFNSRLRQDSATEHGEPRICGKMWGVECLNTTLSIRLQTGYNVKLRENGVICLLLAYYYNYFKRYIFLFIQKNIFLLTFLYLRIRIKKYLTYITQMSYFNILIKKYC